MGDPIITQWRLLEHVCEEPYLGILAGQVTGHPIIGDGWVTTSGVRSLDRGSQKARTESRRYRLGEELPPTEPLPPGARAALLARLLRDAGTLTLSEMNELVAVANRLRGPRAAGSA